MATETPKTSTGTPEPSSTWNRKDPLGGGLKHFFIFTHILGKISHLTSIFFRWVVQPPTSPLQTTFHPTVIQPRSLTGPIGSLSQSHARPRKNGTTEIGAAWFSAIKLARTNGHTGITTQKLVVKLAKISTWPTWLTLCDSTLNPLFIASRQTPCFHTFKDLKLSFSIFFSACQLLEVGENMLISYSFSLRTMTLTDVTVAIFGRYSSRSNS